MKKISNSIRIGKVRREHPVEKLNEDQSSSILQGQAQASQNASVKDRISDQKRIPDFTSPNNIRLNDLTDINTNKEQQHSNDLNSCISQSPSHLQKQKLSDLCEIPTKTKLLTTKKILIGVLAAVVVAAVIATAVVLAVVLSRSSDSSTTTTTSTTTVTSRTVITAFWSFDNVATDLYGGYDGTIQNGATFSPAASNTAPYLGYGRSLYVLTASSQFVLVPTFLDLSYTSFTIEAWISPLSMSGDRGIFGQCQCSTCTNQCLYFIARSGRIHIGFTSNDLTGSTVMSNNNWYHVAFVYNYQTQQQILYLNGVQDAIKSNAQPYQGKNGSIQIGSTQVYSTTNYYNGYIDNLMVITRAKSSDEILRDASLIAYYSFDLPNPVADNGPNRLNGTAVSTVTISGRVNQAMRFTGSSSYFQAYGFYQLPTGMTSNKPFSVSMWMNPTSGNNATFVQLFATSPPPCVNLLGIAAASTTSAQLFILSSNNGPSLMTGPFVSQNTWTHVSLTFSSTIGYTLYVNGIYFGSTGAGTYFMSSTFATLYIGYSTTTCSTAAINTPFQGAIDEVYIHNRELTQTDVTTLANP